MEQSTPQTAQCQVCGTTTEVHQQVHSCPHCETVHHRDCWDYNGGCSTYACAGAPAHGWAPRPVPFTDRRSSLVFSDPMGYRSQPCVRVTPLWDPASPVLGGIPLSSARLSVLAIWAAICVGLILCFLGSLTRADVVSRVGMVFLAAPIWLRPLHRIIATSVEFIRNWMVKLQIATVPAFLAGERDGARLLEEPFRQEILQVLPIRRKHEDRPHGAAVLLKNGDYVVVTGYYRHRCDADRDLDRIRRVVSRRGLQ